MLATGGTDAIINLWHDSTATEKQEAFDKEVSAYLYELMYQWCHHHLLLFYEYFQKWTLLGCLVVAVNVNTIQNIKPS